MNRISAHVAAQPLPPQSSSAAHPMSSSPLPAANGVIESSRAEGDRALATEYRAALLTAARGTADVKISDIPPHSTFGQWWAQLRDAFQSPEVRQWIRDKGISLTSIRLNPVSGQLSFTLKRDLDPKQVRHTVGQEDSRWAAISEPILQAGRVITAGRPETTFEPPATLIDEPVSLSIVGRFYNEPQDLSVLAMRNRAQDIHRNQGFTALDPATSADLIQSRSQDALQEQKELLGDLINRHQAAGELQHLANSVKNGVEYDGQILDELKTMKIFLSSDSTYPLSDEAKSGGVSLLEFLKSHDWDIPTDHAQLTNLATVLSSPAPKAARHGDLGGALSWPEPLDAQSQLQLRADVLSGKIGDVDFDDHANILEYLLNNRPITPDELKNPRQLIETLIDSPRGKALGEAIQARFDARLVKGSATDWLMAALNVDLGGQLSGPLVDLVTVDDSGKKPTEIVKQMSDWLHAHGYASDPASASIQTHIFLANRAPEFLVKNLPEQLRVGSHSWVSFTTAVARIEAKAPGATATMDYAQIMQEADKAEISAPERFIEYAAQHKAIKQWAVLNGITVSDPDMKTARDAFTEQVRELKEAAETQLTDLPTTKAIALEQLKNAFPDIKPAQFDEKNITLQPSNRFFPGPYSILDLYIDGRALLGTPDSANNFGSAGRDVVNFVTFGVGEIPPDGQPATWVSASKAIDIKNVLETLKALPRPQQAFAEHIFDYTQSVKTIATAQLKLLISNQPLADRQNLEFGKLTIRRESTYHRPDFPERVNEGALLVETERDGKFVTYEIDRLKGTITKLPGKSYKEYPPTNGTIPQPGKKFDVITPKGPHKSDIADEHKGAQGTPYSFNSDRTRYIVDAMIQDMDLPAVEAYAKGNTTFDTEVLAHEVAEKVGLALVPFRAAFINFGQGNTAAGVVDVLFDTFGFGVGLAAGVLAKGALVFAAGASGFSRAAQVVKIIGRAAIGAINPLSGVDDLSRLALKSTRKLVGAAYTGVNHLRGAHRSLNLLKLTKKADIAEGTYKAASGAADTKALAKFNEADQKWYRVNPKTQEIYGKSVDFTADTSRLTHSANEAGSATSLLDRGLAQDNVIQLGGAMKDFKLIDSEVHVFYDTYKGTDRLNIVAHGKPYVSNKKVFARNNADIIINDKPYSAEQLVALLKSKGVDPQKFDNVRLLICHSAEGGSRSFGSRMQKVIKKPVKAFEGTVTITHNSTAVTTLRNEYLAALKKTNPEIADTYAHYLANDKVRSGLVGDAVVNVEKHHGSVIKINIADVNQKPQLVDLPISYRPRKFG
ncbi:hypothetical protein KUA23_14990 [Pseudomonas pergaminensis]|uniref:Uncharacterized protein n=1 Tax=Pseudomonas pergaminensis TaxID=2853159 RepID=A0ABD7T9F5_9PSED|nr:hypothetical protein [Pseudomonas pergaminensis]USV98403.1 hypothetical protein KUA23_14990 [Pseudomonas pergaminensis]